MKTSLETANVMFTDTVGSTDTLTRAGPAAAEAQRRQHDTLVANVVTVFGGSIVKSTGDGAVALLPSADHLVRAAAAVQEAAEAGGIELRVGVSTGDVVSEAGDCFGEPVVVASRLCAQCPSGAVLVDATTVGARGHRHEPPVERFGDLVLKGFDEPREIWTVTPSAVRPTHAGDASEPAYGRDQEAERIDAALQTANGPVLIVLGGEPGIGKTHLARTTAERLGDPLWVRFDTATGDGFAAWSTALDGYVSGLPVGVLAALGPDVVAQLVALLPSIAGAFPDAAGEQRLDADREFAFGALAAVVELVARNRVIVLDDVQWAGGTSHSFVAQLLASPERLRLVATSRLPVPDRIASIATLVLPLGGLPPDALDELLRRRGVERVDVEAATRRAGGNPLLALVASDSRAGGTGDPVAERFLVLPPEELELISVAGLVGSTIDLTLLQELTGAPAAQLADRLDAAVRAGLLAEDDGSLVFAHDLVREAAVARLPAHRRTMLHAAAASALLQRGNAVAAIPHVLDGFGALDPDRAVEVVAGGCQQLAGRLAFEEMLAVATRLRDVVGRDQRSRPRHEAAALLIASWAHQLLGDLPRQQEEAAAAGRLARSDGAHLLLVEAALARAGSGPAGVPDPEAAELLESALAVVPEDDLTQRSRLIGMRAYYLMNYEGRGAEARLASLDAVSIARQGGEPGAVADALSGRLFVLLAGSSIVEQVKAAEELRGLVARLPPSRAVEVRAGLQRNLGVLRLQMADRPGFALCHDEVRSLASASHSWLLDAIATMWDGVVALLDGDPELAARHAAAITADREEHNLVASRTAQLTAAHRWRGTLGAIAADVVAEAAAQPEQPLPSSAATVVEAITGDGDAGRRLDEVLRRSPLLVDDPTLAAQLATVIEACALTGRQVPEAVTAALEPFAGQLLVLSWGVDVLGAADRFLAIAAARSGDLAAAAAAFDRAAELEARVSVALPLRTHVWRHVLLGDVPPPEIPGPLAGLAVEADALRVSVGR